MYLTACFVRPPPPFLADLDKTMQRFLRKPMRVTLATLLGVYRAVMRLSSIAGALKTAFACSSEDQNVTEEESGPQLLRKHLISPLQQVHVLIVFLVRHILIVIIERFRHILRGGPKPIEPPVHA